VYIIEKGKLVIKIISALSCPGCEIITGSAQNLFCNVIVHILLSLGKLCSVLCLIEQQDKREAASTNQVSELRSAEKWRNAIACI
jgi:hypothetical protein